MFLSVRSTWLFIWPLGTGTSDSNVPVYVAIGSLQNCDAESDRGVGEPLIWDVTMKCHLVLFRRGRSYWRREYPLGLFNRTALKRLWQIFSLSSFLLKNSLACKHHILRQTCCVFILKQLYPLNCVCVEFREADLFFCCLKERCDSSVVLCFFFFFLRCFWHWSY